MAFVIAGRRMFNDAEGKTLTKLLTKRGLTDAQLAEAMGLLPRTAAAWRRKVGGCYVTGWAEDERGRLFTPVWRIGEGENAPRPGDRRTDAERMRELRARKLAEKGGAA